jgi:hypothetical protein
MKNWNLRGFMQKSQFRTQSSLAQAVAAAIGWAFGRGVRFATSGREVQEQGFQPS